MNMLKLFWIAKNICFGPAPQRKELKQLKEKYKIDAIIDLRKECCDDKKILKKLGIQFLNIKIRDRNAPTLNQLKKIFKFINHLSVKKKRLFIHCQNGYGRSSLIMLAILVKEGLSIAEAMKLIMKKNPNISFSTEQEKFILFLE